MPLDPPRPWFEAATAGVLEVVGTALDADWTAPGLGGWTRLELLAHTMRSWTLIATYLAQPEPGEASDTAATYFAHGLGGPAAHEAILQRGRDEAAGLGPDPAAAAHEAATAALAVVAATPDDRPIATRICPLPFAEFLRTRAFELTVHGLDLGRALGTNVPPALLRATAPAIALAGEIAAEQGHGVGLLLAATGRESLPQGFSVVG